MTMNRHEPFEELISGSLTGDLTDAERQRLDAHLDGCAACRATLAAFADQRRIVSGLRHIAPPRDLGARVRAAVERRGFGVVPWWRRPAVMFGGVGGGLAAIAGVLLALVLLNGPTEDAAVGDASATPSPTAIAVVASPSDEPQPTLPPILPTPQPNASPVESIAPPPPSVEPSPTTTPVPASPEPDVFLALTGPFDNLNLTVQEPVPSGEPPDPITEVEVVEAPNGPPIAAELSPDGQWLAFIVELGLSGMNEVRATRVAIAPSEEPPTEGTEIGEVAILGRSIAGTPFLERLAWSPDGRRLAYTLADPDADGATDVWIFEPDAAEPARLTDTGNAYAASWIPDRDADPASRLWVSLAAEDPASYVLELDPDEEIAVTDPTREAIKDAPGVFMPTLSPDGRLAIYWTGRMAQEDGLPWILSEDGEPYLAEHDVRDATYEFGNERPLFSDLRVEGDGFASAAISWGADGDAYAIWDAAWTGDSQGAEDSQYPDPLRVYFGHATDARGLTRNHAIDRADLPVDGSVVDVKVSPTGQHLLVTVRYPLEGDLSVPRADLLLIKRNTGRVFDEITRLNFNDEGWFGPAAFDGSDDGGGD
jgi:hypothetical protein